MDELDAVAEAEELRGLVTLLDEERTGLLAELDQERQHSNQLARELREAREGVPAGGERLAGSAQEVSEMRKRLAEADELHRELQARVDEAERTKARCMRREEEALRSLSSLAAKAATLEGDNEKLRISVAEQSSDGSCVLMDTAALEVENASLRAEMIALKAELDDAKMHRDLDSVDSPASSPPAPPLARGVGVTAREAHEPAITAECLSDLDEDQLAALVEQYAARTSHFSALRRDAERELHRWDPSKHADPDLRAPAEAGPVVASHAAGAAAADLDKDWLELAHWMRGRFGTRTSLRELKAHVGRFAPRKLRAPDAGAAADSAGSAPSAAPFDGASQGGLSASLADRDVFDKIFAEARQRGRDLYHRDRQSLGASWPSA
ncbi:hypothetical protein DIPPA_23946 [Diplonema papillatum]|nr:hypothetical protein DIPPA_23946 [Diplonema papillatum]